MVLGFCDHCTLDQLINNGASANKMEAVFSSHGSEFQMWVTFILIIGAFALYVVETTTMEMVSVGLICILLVFFNFFPIPFFNLLTLYVVRRGQKTLLKLLKLALIFIVNQFIISFELMLVLLQLKMIPKLRLF